MSKLKIYLSEVPFQYVTFEKDGKRSIVSAIDDIIGQNIFALSHKNTNFQRRPFPKGAFF